MCALYIEQLEKDQGPQVTSTRFELSQVGGVAINRPAPYGVSGQAPQGELIARVGNVLQSGCALSEPFLANVVAKTFEFSA